MLFLLSFWFMDFGSNKTSNNFKDLMTIVLSIIIKWDILYIVLSSSKSSFESNILEDCYSFFSIFL